MSTTAIETLNTWGPAWADAMQRSLVEATVLLAIVGLAWLILRRWMSSALAHGLFLLVLVKAAVPIVLSSPPTVVVPLPEMGGRSSIRADETPEREANRNCGAPPEPP